MLIRDKTILRNILRILPFKILNFLSQIERKLRILPNFKKRFENESVIIGRKKFLGKFRDEVVTRSLETNFIKNIFPSPIDDKDE